MYSVVLMAALTAGTQAPACHWSCCGCGGGYGWGCGGCYGGCWGGYGYGGYGYGGWGYGGSGYGYGCYGCGGCWGCGGYGAYSNYGPTYGAPAGAEPVPAPKSTSALPNQASTAQLAIDLPTDAKLYVDDHAMKSASAHRVFTTPTLDSGKTYYYILRAEVVRDGKTVSQDRRVILRAGDRITASFADLGKEPVVATAKR
jgi:uncharacterized protein (TIGR03000 family)